MPDRPHILIVGGGYVGMYTALRLQKKLRRNEARITVVDPQNYMTYQPFLPETAAGSLEPRHVVVPLRKVLRHCQVLTGMVTRIDHANRTATVLPVEGPEVVVSYDVIVVAPGSVVRTLPIPGLAESGIGFKTVGEAIYLRNHVLSRLDYAASVADSDRRRRALTFVFIGGGYAGIEAFAELEDMARYATRYYDNVDADDMRWMLVEATGRILPEVSVQMAEYTVQQLLKRNMDIRLDTRVESLTGGHVVLSDGEEFDAETIVWTAGVKPNRPAAGREGQAAVQARPASRRRGERVGRRRLRGGARPHQPGRVHRPVGAARGPADQDARGQHRGRAAPAEAGRLPAQVRRLGRQSRPLPRRRRGVRDQAAWLAGLVHAPHVPRVADADGEPQGQGAGRLDAGDLLPA
jgi:NADH dehydrogenase FAD-containing subunit